MKLWLAKIQQSATAFWAMRDARERRMLLIGASVIIAALYYLLLIAPALAGRETIKRELPLLHDQVAQLQALSGEARALDGLTAADVTVMSKETLNAALTAHGLQAQSINMLGETAQIQLKGVSFANILACLNELQQNAHIRVSAAKFTSLALGDQVDATLTLRQAGAL